MKELRKAYFKAHEEYKELSKKQPYYVKENIYIYFRITEILGIDNPRLFNDYLIKCMKETKDKSDLSIIYELALTDSDILKSIKNNK